MIEVGQNIKQFNMNKQMVKAAQAAGKVGQQSGAKKAWEDFKAGYMNRTEHIGKPISAEQNQAEYDREKNEFYYDTKKGKMRLIPTDDGEVQDRGGIEDWQLAPSMAEPKKSALNMLGISGGSPLKNEKNIKPRTGYNTMHMDDKRAKEISELSINRSLAGKAASKKMKRTEVGRNLKPAGKVNVEHAKEGITESMQTMTEKAKPVNIPQPKPKKKGQSFESRSREHMRAPSKNMGVSMRSNKSALNMLGISKNESI